MAKNIEEKRSKFKKFANLRLNNALDALRIVGNLSNKNLYEYNDDEAAKIVSILRDALNSVKIRFDENKNITKNKNKKFF